ncbi:MAG: alkaline phosphatase [Gammaproteobacteria bacterium]|nr:alkaline phosphatase [Gammaproteobacteria bacterium]
MVFRFHSLGLVVCLVALLFAAGAGSAQKPDRTTRVAPKNIILMIGDGMGPAQLKAYRMYQDNPAQRGIEPLRLDRHLVGTLATDPKLTEAQAESLAHYQVTDSAASATAYSTGQRTFNGAIAVDIEQQPLPTILEQAKRRGMKVGLVATSQIVHATPAAFIAHVPSRRQYNEIADAFVDNQFKQQPLVDVFLGGGWQYFAREDRNLVAELKAHGYTVIRTQQELANAGAKVAGLFADVALAAAKDRPATQPSLATMTTAAIERLEQNNGFFLMVEGSQIDWSAHANDIAGVVQEMDDFHQAVEVALDFAAKEGNTLVIVTADHETGGLSIGRKIGDDSPYAYHVQPLRNLQHSMRWYLEHALAEKSLQTFLQHTGIELTEPETKQWQSLQQTPDKKQLWTLLLAIMDRVTFTGWTTNGHTGVDVNLYAFGLGAERLRGYHDNDFIGKQIQLWLNEAQQ